MTPVTVPPETSASLYPADLTTVLDRRPRSTACEIRAGTPLPRRALQVSR
ncbi:hypothetical protein J8J14_03510 [Roseomonas sp. SSH11]|uniref:Uncharacterized protein n=1 Tax=Pararoseomonas baculiformis TaxID=2820812 RepID=A0ABS4AA33_9PROT|nr:hypothetical protein [Pararoseomonas baculiformis]MBP0443838.1 hypothetical protein [Pararoseomonas baculiformis]